MLDSPQVALEMLGHNRPVVIRSTGPGEYAYVMMPIVAPREPEPAKSGITVATNASR
jgi:hypothetical protein